jgi:hypothetical protein
MDKKGDGGLRDFPEGSEGGAGTGGERWILRSSLPGKAGWKLWYDWQIPRLAKKYRPDWVMTSGGVAAAGKTPQICWMPGDPGMMGSGKRADRLAGKGLAGLYRKRLAGSLRAARGLFCFSEEAQLFLKGMLPTAGAGANTPILVVPPAAGPAFAPLSMEEREKAKLAYAGGKEYFFTELTGAGEEAVVNLLKAFSRFKKRQLSNMQLVLAGTAGGPSGGSVARAIEQRLETYKYRQDIHLYPAWSPARDGQGMTGGAYAIVRPFDRVESGLSIVEAWKARVPVIGVSTDARRLKGEGQDAGPLLVAGADDPASLAEKLMMIYKDEALRSSLVERGAVRAEGLDWAQTAAAIWAVLSGPEDQGREGVKRLMLGNN